MMVGWKGMMMCFESVAVCFILYFCFGYPLFLDIYIYLRLVVIRRFFHLKPLYILLYYFGLVLLPFSSFEL